jgi:hypothetical protein
MTQEKCATLHLNYLAKTVRYCAAKKKSNELGRVYSTTATNAGRQNRLEALFPEDLSDKHCWID